MSLRRAIFGPSRAERYQEAEIKLLGAFLGFAQAAIECAAKVRAAEIQAGGKKAQEPETPEER